MTSQELSNMIFNIKDKITDKEFKDLMDKLSVKHKEDERDTYELRYIKRDTRLFPTKYRNIGWRLNEKIKTKKVKLGDVFNFDIDRIIEKQNGFFDDIDTRGYNFDITKMNGVRYISRIEADNDANDEWLNNYDVKCDANDADEYGIWFSFNTIFPIHIKKSTYL